MPNGYKHTEKAKRKMRFAHIGKKSSKETKKKLSEIKKGHIISEETRKKISISNKGQKRTEELRNKLSKIRKDNPNRYWLGRKRPEIREYLGTSDVREKISLSLRKEIHKTDESKIWRTRIEYRLWREAVFARDNWNCQKCKKRGDKLHPHHIRNFAEEDKLRFAIDNGTTLCEDCHRLFHKKFGRKRNNLEQIIQFINE